VLMDGDALRQEAGFLGKRNDQTNLRLSSGPIRSPASFSD
jgi:hypothetical protein